MNSRGIPMVEVIRLLKQAEKAAAENDLAQIDSINAALVRAGLKIIIRDDGEVRLGKASE